MFSSHTWQRSGNPYCSPRLCVIPPETPFPPAEPICRAVSCLGCAVRLFRSRGICPVPWLRSEHASATGRLGCDWDTKRAEDEAKLGASLLSGLDSLMASTGHSQICFSFTTGFCSGSTAWTPDLLSP